MPKKKSVKKAASVFREQISETIDFVKLSEKGLSDAHLSRLYDTAIIFLYRDFENLILEVLVGAINNDTGTIKSTLGIDFPKHLTDEVCYYIATGPSYFDFKGRDGLIKRVKQYVPDKHYLVTTLKDSKYKLSIERLCALRNFAVHGSPQSKRAVLKAIKQTRVGSAGSWLKKQGRLHGIMNRLKELATDLENRAPF